MTAPKHAARRRFPIAAFVCAVLAGLLVGALVAS